MQPVDPAGGVQRRRTVVVRRDRVEVERHPDLRLRRDGPDGVDGQAVPEHQVVGGRNRGVPLGSARRMQAGAVAQERRAPRLVERDPVLDPVAEREGGRRRQLGEPVRGLPGRPATGVLERLGQVPVVERHPGRDAGGEQLVDEAVVEVEPGAIGKATAVGQDPRPGHGEPVRAQAEFAHQGDVLAVAVHVVARDQAGVAVADPARGGREGVPDRRRAAVLVGGALDLVRRGRGAPDEVRRKPARQRRDAVGRSELGCRGHCFRPPSMMPPTIWRPNRMKTMSSGTTPSRVPAITSAWSV